MSTNTHADREQRRGGRAVNTGISGGSSPLLWMFEQKCIRHWEVGGVGGGQFSYVNTQQLPFLDSFRRCAETSHCLNSAHSIPVPGPRPAAASSLPPARAETGPRDRARVLPDGQKGSYRHAKTGLV